MATLTKGLIQRQDFALYDGTTLTATRQDSTGGTLSGLRINDWVDVLSVFGDGQNYTYGTIRRAVQALGSTNVALSFAPGTWVIDTNLTIPSNFTCIVPAGCVFAPASGITLTIQGVLFRMHATYTGGAGTVTVSGTDLLASTSSTYATDTGAADAYAIATSPPIAGYTAGQQFSFKATNTNTGASTLNVDGQGAKSIKKNGSTALAAGDITSGQVYVVIYDGTNFQLQFQPASSFIQTLLDDTDAAAARSTLGIDPQTTAPAKWEVIASGSSSNVATLDFTGLSTTYIAYLLMFENLAPATDNVDLWLRLSDDAGATYEADASDYSWAHTGVTEAGSSNAVGDDADSEISLGTGFGNGAAEKASGQIMLYNPAGAGITQITFEIVRQSAIPVFVHYDGGGQIQAAGATTAFRLIHSSGNISTITYTLFGMRAS